MKRTHIFNSLRSVIGEDIPIPHREPARRRSPLMEHDKAFKPTQNHRTGITASLGRFPVYIEDPKKPLTRKMEEEDERKKFKPTHNSKSRPSPSVTTNLRNLKSSFPSVFKR